MNLMVLPNQLYLIVKLYINRPELLPDTHGFDYLDYFIADVSLSIIHFFILPSKSIWMDSTLNQFEYFGSVG